MYGLSHRSFGASDIGAQSASLNPDQTDNQEIRNSQESGSRSAVCLANEMSEMEEDIPVAKNHSTPEAPEPDMGLEECDGLSFTFSDRFA